MVDSPTRRKKGNSGASNGSEAFVSGGAPAAVPVIKPRHARPHRQNRDQERGGVEQPRHHPPPKRRDLQPARTSDRHTNRLSHRSYPKEISAIPATTATAPISRSAPIRSRPVIASTAVAITTLDSRTAETDAAGASLSAASASA